MSIAVKGANSSHDKETTSIDKDDVCHLDFTLRFADGGFYFLNYGWGGETGRRLGPTHVKNPNGPPYLVIVGHSRYLEETPQLLQRLELRADELLNYYKEHDPERKQPILFVMREMGVNEDGEPLYEVDEEASAYYRPRSSNFHPLSQA